MRNECDANKRNVTYLSNQITRTTPPSIFHSCKPQNDDETVITSNTSSTVVTSDTATDRPTASAFMTHVSPRIKFKNYYEAIQDLDDKCIAVDSGASDGFGDADTPGTDRQSVP